MKWEEMQDMRLSETKTGQRLTDIECPECGRFIYIDTSIVLTSYPVKYRYWCTCGWTGYSHVKWEEGRIIF